MGFLADRDKGAEGERVVRELLERSFKALTVAEKGPFKDYDLRDEATWAKIETKADFWALQTGNIAIEIWSHLDKRHEGWIQYSAADILAYLIYERGTKQPHTLLLYSLPCLKSYIFLDVLNENWLSDAPAIGRLSSAKHKGNANVSNLLLPINSLTSCLMSSIHIKKGD